MSEFLTKNYFELFDLPLEYEVNLKNLRERFRDLQKAVHPDKFSAESAESQRLAVQYAAHVNQAFQTLKDPIARGFCLLALRGYQCGAESATINDGAFLMQQIEFRERLEVANDEALAELLAEIEHELNDLGRQVSHCIQAMGYDQAEALLKKMQFYKRLTEEVENRM